MPTINIYAVYGLKCSHVIHIYIHTDGPTFIENIAKFYVTWNTNTPKNCLHTATNYDIFYVLATGKCNLLCPYTSVQITAC